MARALVKTIKDRGISKIQTKVLSSVVSSTGVFSELTFNNLEIDKWYEVFLQGRLVATTGITNLEIKHDSVLLAAIEYEGDANSRDTSKTSTKVAFKATASTVIFESTVLSGSITGDGTGFGTFAQLKELNGGELVETTDFT